MTSEPVLPRMGARPRPDGGVDFHVFSRRAERLVLMLFDRAADAHPRVEIEAQPLPAAGQDGWWHAYARDAAPGDYYLYRAEGDPAAGFHSGQWLLDPCVRAVDWNRAWGEADGLRPGHYPERGRAFPKGRVVSDDFDWEGDRPPGHRLADSVIYEAHLRGYTAHDSSGAAAPGTYLGFIEKIPHLLALGVTAVEFLPLQEFNEMEFYLENEARAGLLNFWGYSTLAFFAPMARYASDPHGGAAQRDCKTLIKALHAAGIEVILDVVFNHTAEGDHRGPVYSFKGLDRDTYYMMERDGVHFKNFSGCGNTLNANDPYVQDFVIGCLRYWVEAFHVDGFRFDLASALTRGPDGVVLDRPPLIERLSRDPVLQPCKLIAEAWDATGLNQVGRFPARRWAEWNGLYRDDVRRFWAGEPGFLGALATRLAGSADLYEKDDFTPQKSINFITCHDGFTLADLVSYRHKHNRANHENNRDGESSNYSDSCGHEGPTADPVLQARRRRRQKNLLATLLLSSGVPMMLAGDEFGRTQRGNNNAYGQDNDLSWVDWRGLEMHRDLFDFACKIVRFRRERAVLRRARFFRGARDGETWGDVAWFAPDGQGAPDWQGGRALGYRLSGLAKHTGAAHDEASLYVALNGSTESVRFVLPPAGDGRVWRLCWTTHANEPERTDAFILQGESLAVFEDAGAPSA